MLCGMALVLCGASAAGLVFHTRAVARQRAEAVRLAAETAFREAEAVRLAAETVASEAARREQEQRRAEEAAALRQQQVSQAEGTQINCDLYWGDSNAQFDAGAGCHAEDGCVLPGENGTVFVGAHTGTFFADLGSAEVGGHIYLDTDWGEFVYEITETQVIYETDIDKVRWGAEEPSCILYTCYPFGILTHTDRRYAVYADPVETDEYGVVPQDTAIDK